MSNIPSISVVVPVYNSEGTLPLLVNRLQPVLDTIASEYEIILVNDGSRDQSWAVCQALAATFPFVHGINLMRNSGQHNALLCGIRATHGSLIVTIDDDLQNPPEQLPMMLAKLNEGYDVVYGTPRHQQHGFLRDMASQITKLVLQGSMGVESATRVSAYRIFRCELLRAFASYNALYVSIDVLLTWGTSRFSYVTIEHDARTIGQSNYTVRKLMRHAMNMVTGFSILPLQVASLLGFVFMFFGFLVMAYVIGRLIIEGGSVPGFPFLASIISLFAGVQLFTLGIMGEYMARMHVRLMDRPSYTILEETSPKERILD